MRAERRHEVHQARADPVDERQQLVTPAGDRPGAAHGDGQPVEHVEDAGAGRGLHDRRLPVGQRVRGQQGQRLLVTGRDENLVGVGGQALLGQPRRQRGTQRGQTGRVVAGCVERGRGVRVGRPERGDRGPQPVVRGQRGGGEVDECRRVPQGGDGQGFARGPRLTRPARARHPGAASLPGLQNPAVPEVGVGVRDRVAADGQPPGQ